MRLQLPERFEEYAEGRRAGFLKMKELKERGQRVAGTFCTFTPQEILDAAGFVSVSLCGMSPETIPEAERHLPKYLCPLIKSSYGFALADKCPYTYWSDIIVGETTCDGKKKMYELLDKIRPTYVLQLPQDITRPSAKEEWAQELRRFITYLEEKFGVTITNEMLRAAAEKRNILRRERVELMELQRQIPAPLPGLQQYKFLEGLGFQFSVDSAIAATRDLKDEVKAMAPAGSGACKRLMVTGCPIGGVLEKVVGAAERSGGQVVCFENCSGIKAARCFVDTGAEDMVEAIAEAYLQIGCAVLSPNPRRMENIPRLAEEFRVDGVIDVTLQACHAYLIETRAVRKLCREHDLPYMALETDYSQSDSGQLDTRIAAFIETL